MRNILSPSNRPGSPMLFGGGGTPMTNNSTSSAPKVAPNKLPPSSSSSSTPQSSQLRVDRLRRKRIEVGYHSVTVLRKIGEGGSSYVYLGRADLQRQQSETKGTETAGGGRSGRRTSTVGNRRSEPDASVVRRSRTGPEESERPAPVSSDSCSSLMLQQASSFGGSSSHSFSDQEEIENDTTLKRSQGRQHRNAHSRSNSLESYVSSLEGGDGEENPQDDDDHTATSTTTSGSGWRKVLKRAGKKLGRTSSAPSSSSASPGAVLPPSSASNGSSITVVLKATAVTTRERHRQTAVEVEMLRRLSKHPNVLAMFDFCYTGPDMVQLKNPASFQSGRIHYILLEHCAGGCLLDMIAAQRKEATDTSSAKHKLVVKKRAGRRRLQVDTDDASENKDDDDTASSPRSLSLGPSAVLEKLTGRSGRKQATLNVGTIAPDKYIDLKVILHIFRQIADVVSFMHNRDDEPDGVALSPTSVASTWSSLPPTETHAASKGQRRTPIVHRDLKPENVLLTFDDDGDGYSGTPQSMSLRSVTRLISNSSEAGPLSPGRKIRWKVKLCDFGSTIVGRVPLRNAADRLEAAEVIRQSTTQMYRAPEMIDLHMVDELTEKTDIWALGCCLYTTCFLRNCFEQNSNLAILSGRYRIPDNHPYGDGLEELLRRMLVIDPAGRADIDEVSACLKALDLGLPLPPSIQSLNSWLEARDEGSDTRNRRRENTFLLMADEEPSSYSGGGTHGNPSHIHPLFREQASGYGNASSMPSMKNMKVPDLAETPLSESSGYGNAGADEDQTIPDNAVITPTVGDLFRDIDAAVFSDGYLGTTSRCASPSTVPENTWDLDGGRKHSVSLPNSPGQMEVASRGVGLSNEMESLWSPWFCPVELDDSESLLDRIMGADKIQPSQVSREAHQTLARGGDLEYTAPPCQNFASTESFEMPTIRRCNSLPMDQAKSEEAAPLPSSTTGDGPMKPAPLVASESSAYSWLVSGNAAVDHRRNEVSEKVQPLGRVAAAPFPQSDAVVSRRNADYPFSAGSTPSRFSVDIRKQGRRRKHGNRKVLTSPKESPSSSKPQRPPRPPYYTPSASSNPASPESVPSSFRYAAGARPHGDRKRVNDVSAAAVGRVELSVKLDGSWDRCNREDASHGIDDDASSLLSQSEDDVRSASGDGSGIFRSFCPGSGLLMDRR